MRVVGLCLATLLALPVTAQALCNTTSIDDDFSQSVVVVRARLKGTIRAWSDFPSAAYQAEWGYGGAAERSEFIVVEVFKGTDPDPVVFQYIDSGRIDLDVDKDYLLFLHAGGTDEDMPSQARGTYYVRFACGPSKPWSELSDAEVVELRRLAPPHQP